MSAGRTDGSSRDPVPTDFDPSGPAASDTLFGLPRRSSEAGVVVLPVPFEATTSYRRGTAAAPEAIRAASSQVDLWDCETGSPWRAGIVMADLPSDVAGLNAAASRDAALARAGDRAALGRVDKAGEALNELVDAWTSAQLTEGRVPAILGGDHSVALGAMRAAARRRPGLGVLQVDAHADLREAYEGFTWSHASVIFNLLQQADEVGPLVQVAIRDQCEEEWSRAREHPRVVQWSDVAIGEALAGGGSWVAITEEIVAPLPREVWVTFDVDGLDPALCPATGTPVPGGLSWREALVLLATLARSGRRIVGFDLCEVGPDEWDAIVGARLLYKLAGWAVVTNSKGSGGTRGRS